MQSDRYLTKNCLILIKLGLNVRKPVFGGLRTTKEQTSLCIHAVLLVPLFFAYWKVSYLDLLRAKFQISTLGNPKHRFCRVEAKIQVAM